MEFVSAFCQVDTDHDNKISADDLNKFADRMGYNRQFTQKWLTLFDDDNDNIITLEEFCGVLGLDAMYVADKFCKLDSTITSKCISSEHLADSNSLQLSIDVKLGGDVQRLSLEGLERVDSFTMTSVSSLDESNLEFDPQCTTKEQDNEVEESRIVIANLVVNVEPVNQFNSSTWNQTLESGDVVKSKSPSSLSASLKSNSVDKKVDRANKQRFLKKKYFERKSLEKQQKLNLKKEKQAEKEVKALEKRKQRDEKEKRKRFEQHEVEKQSKNFFKRGKKQCLKYETNAASDGIGEKKHNLVENNPSSEIQVHKEHREIELSNLEVNDKSHQSKVEKDIADGLMNEENAHILNVIEIDAHVKQTNCGNPNDSHGAVGDNARNVEDSSHAAADVIVQTSTGLESRRLSTFGYYSSSSCSSSATSQKCTVEAKAASVQSPTVALNVQLLHASADIANDPTSSEDMKLNRSHLTFSLWRPGSFYDNLELAHECVLWPTEVTACRFVASESAFTFDNSIVRSSDTTSQIFKDDALTTAKVTQTDAMQQQQPHQRSPSPSQNCCLMDLCIRKISGAMTAPSSTELKTSSPAAVPEKLEAEVAKTFELDDSDYDNSTPHVSSRKIIRANYKMTSQS